MKEAIDLMVMRTVAGSNQYLFANQYGSGHLRGSDVLRNHSKLSKAEHPENLRATKLRKFIATVSQVMKLDRKRA